MNELPKSNLTLEEYNEISNTIKKIYGDDFLTYTDYGDLIYVYPVGADIDFDNSFYVINNEKVTYIETGYVKVMKKLKKTLRNKKLKRIIEDD